MARNPVRLHSRLTALSPASLKAAGILGIFLDIDNTLTHHHSQDLPVEVAAWLDAAKEAGLSLILVSNAKEKRVAPFAEKIGLPFISVACKPLPFGYLRAAKRLSLDKSACLAIGDQVFTDLWAAKAAGVPAVLTEPFEEESGPTFRVRRRLEKPIRRRLARKTAKEESV